MASSPLIAIFLTLLCSAPFLLKLSCQALGWTLIRANRSRRALLLSRVRTEEIAIADGNATSELNDNEQWEEIEEVDKGSAKDDFTAGEGWAGVIGFLHPFCNAGGGGERVLWAALKATQARFPKALCVVYTGDHDIEKRSMLRKVEERFNIRLHSPTIHFLYLTKRGAVVPSRWPRFTLAGQSLGSLAVAYEAFSLLVPDIFIDTMGYAFALALCKILFPTLPTGAYVHYPTISTDMLESLSLDGRGVNAGQGSGIRGILKRLYWRGFAKAYCWAGSQIDVVMTNSSWTQSHIETLWSRQQNEDVTRLKMRNTVVVFPPVAVEELESAIDVSSASEAQRMPYFVYIAQFRPEKEHTMILHAFAKYLSSIPDNTGAARPKLVLIGSVRDSDDATRVYQLRLLAHDLKLSPDAIDFVADATWPQILTWLRSATIGINGMWNEHFGIGVVEYQAAGLISIVNNSGGPKRDIVIDVDGKPTGYHASSIESYAKAFADAMNLPIMEKIAMRQRARISAQRFTEKEFSTKWLAEMERLVGLEQNRYTKIR